MLKLHPIIIYRYEYNFLMINPSFFHDFPSVLTFFSQTHICKKSKKSEENGQRLYEPVLTRSGLTAKQFAINFGKMNLRLNEKRSTSTWAVEH